MALKALLNCEEVRHNADIFNHVKKLYSELHRRRNPIQTSTGITRFWQKYMGDYFLATGVDLGCALNDTGGNVGDSTNIHNISPIIDLDGRIMSFLTKANLEEMDNVCSDFFETLCPKLPMRLELALDYLLKSFTQEATAQFAKGFDAMLNELPPLEICLDDDKDILLGIFVTLYYLVIHYEPHNPGGNFTERIFCPALFRSYQKRV